VKGGDDMPRINLELPLEEIRSLVLETFKNLSQSDITQYLTVCSNVASLAVQKQLVQNPSNGLTYHVHELSSIDQDKIREIIWDLIIERVITIGGNSSNPNWPWLSLTEYGRHVVNSSNPTPHDPSGYLSRINQEIPNIDPIILRYLEESLRTYNINALLSSTITLGCASEKALLILIDSFASAIQDQHRKTKFIADTEGRFIKRQFEVFTKNYSGIEGNLPGDLTDGVNTVLLGIFEMIRNNRNDVGHPTGISISREQVYANLQVFMPYCKKVYSLKSYFESNPII